MTVRPALATRRSGRALQRAGFFHRDRDADTEPLLHRLLQLGRQAGRINGGIIGPGLDLERQGIECAVLVEFKLIMR